MTHHGRVVSPRQWGWLVSQGEGVDTVVALMRPTVELLLLLLLLLLQMLLVMWV